MKRVFSGSIAMVLAVLLCSLAFAPLCLPAFAEGETDQPSFTLSGEVSRESREILLKDGTPTGVTWTQVQLNGTYGSKVVNVAEFSLANTHLSLEVINSGSTIVGSAATDKACDTYTKTHKGQTVLAAVNGDLWMTGVNSNSKVTTKVLKTTRGVLILDGEIWASQEIDMENAENTDASKGSPASDKAAFGVTGQNQPVVGSPVIEITLAIEGLDEMAFKADGLNRLPCMDSLIVYNQRINSTNYALNDAYEVEIEMDDSSAFTAGGHLTGTVKAIYPPDSTTRPAPNNPKTVVLTARGKKISTLQNFYVDDRVSFDVSLTDRWGHTDLWQDVQEAIGGHMQVLVDGKQGVAQASSSEYPTSLIGYRDDGSVMLVTVSSTQQKKYAGLKFNQVYQFCREMGYNSVFYLDGGGSATFVTLEEGTYTVRNNCSDGSPRAVINSVGVVWNDEPVCKRQGSLAHIEVPVDLSQIRPTYLDGALLAEVTGAPNGVSLSYDEAERAFVMTTKSQTADPYATLSLASMAEVKAQDYPFLVFKVKTDNTKFTNFMLFYAAGKNTGANANYTKSFQVKPQNEWQYITVNMSTEAGWTGVIHNFRLDIFDSTTTPAGVSMYIGSVTLCRSEEEAAKVKDGWIPEDAIGDFLAYKESLQPPTHNFEVKYDDEAHWDECVDCGRIENKTVHALTGAYDETAHWQVCDECGAIVGKADHEIICRPDGDSHLPTCACGWTGEPQAHEFTLTGSGDFWNEYTCVCGMIRRDEAELPTTETTEETSEETSEETTEGTTEAATEAATTEAPETTEAETTAEESTAPAATTAEETTTTAATEDTGCASVIGLTGLVVLLSLAGISLRKKQ